MHTLSMSQQVIPSRFLGYSFLSLTLMVIIMVAIGGLTRLTGSGLSIVEWKPIIGILPPLNEYDWEQLFALYKQYPEFKKINSYMNLGDFKSIFWLEYIHRVWGRLMGMVLLAPTIYIVIKPEFRFMWRRVAYIWLLGGLQGFMGWYMVKSGLVNNPWVSHYRLTAHLLLAFLIVGVLLRNAHFSFTGLVWSFNVKSPMTVFLGLLILTVTLGGFTAGLHAGKIYNTFPMMGDSIIPEDFLHLAPLWHNFLENPSTIQFMHRVAAISTVAFAVYLAIQYKDAPFIHLASFAFIQLGLGIATLLLIVPTDLAVMHQTFAMIIFSYCIYRLPEMVSIVTTKN